ncbi:MAG: hypothetical protein LCH37_05465 [Bacteroidetes bacterium]|nr:hypothetical protein [Bacteroidota bacterium]
MECSKCRILIEPFQKVYFNIHPKIVLPKRIESVQRDYLLNYGLPYILESDVLISDSLFGILPNSINPTLYVVFNNQVQASIDLFETQINLLTSLPQKLEVLPPIIAPQSLSASNLVYANENSFLLNDRLKKSLIYYRSDTFLEISTDRIDLKQVSFQLCGNDSDCIRYFLKSHNYLNSKNIAKSEFGSGFIEKDTLFVIANIPRLIAEKKGNKLQREQFMLTYHGNNLFNVAKIVPTKKHIAIDPWNNGGLFKFKDEYIVNGGKYGLFDKQSQQNLFKLEGRDSLEIKKSPLVSKIPKSLVQASKGFMDYTSGDLLLDTSSVKGYYFKSNFSYFNFANSKLIEDHITKVPSDSIFILYSFLNKDLIYSFHRNNSKKGINLRICQFTTGEFLVELPNFLSNEVIGIFRLGNFICYYKENSKQIERIKIFD